MPQRYTLLGDSLVLPEGLGGLFPGAAAYPFKGKSSAYILANGPQSIEGPAIFSAGSNDIGMPVQQTVNNALGLLNRYPKAQPTFILPANDRTRADALDAALKGRARTVRFQPGGDGIHPASYRGLYGDIMGQAAAPQAAAPNYRRDAAQLAIGVGRQLGVDPADVLTAIGYETIGSYDQWQRGPRTKWGQHRGRIQWGEPQRAKYGVYKGMPLDQEIAATAAYLRDAGVRPGMGLEDIYSAINAGQVGRPNASDRPGMNVRSHVAGMGPFRRQADQLLSYAGDATASDPTAAAFDRSPRLPVPLPPGNPNRLPMPPPSGGVPGVGPRSVRSVQPNPGDAGGLVLPGPMDEAMNEARGARRRAGTEAPYLLPFSDYARNANAPMRAPFAPAPPTTAPGIPMNGAANPFPMVPAAPPPDAAQGILRGAMPSPGILTPMGTPTGAPPTGSSSAPPSGAPATTGGLPAASQGAPRLFPGGLFGDGRTPIRDFLRDHSGAMMSAGLAMALAPDAQSGYQGLMSAIGTGAQADASRRESREKREMLAQNQQRLDQAVTSLGHPEWAGLPAEILDQLLAESFKPQDQWVDTTVNGMPGQRNKRTNQFDPYTTTAPTETWKPLVDPAERAAAGIPPEDKRPYKVSSRGDLQAVGGGGVTVNNITEGERRNMGIAEVVKPELAVVEQTWPALSDLVQQSVDKIPLVGNAIVSPEYQRGRTSVRSIVASYLYSISGATANPGEVETQTDLLMPQIGDKAPVIQDKLNAIRARVRAIEVSAGGPATPVGDAYEQAAKAAVTGQGGKPDADGWVEVPGVGRYRVLPGK